MYSSNNLKKKYSYMRKKPKTDDYEAAVTGEINSFYLIGYTLLFIAHKCWHQATNGF